MVRKIMRMRITLIPPAVEPAHPPTNMSRMRVILAAVSHRSKSAVTNPVVVIMLETANAESLSPLPQESP
jgi:hypothetical protein